MKAPVGTLALIGVLLSAGSAPAQVAPQPRGGTSPATAPRTTVTSVSTGGQSGSENAETRATLNQSGGVIAAEATAPVNGIGGTGGGRMSNRGRSEDGETRATANPSGGPIDIESWSWGRIDRVNTVQACAARGGAVVMHEGVQQCRLPATARREEAGSAMGQVSTTR